MGIMRGAMVGLACLSLAACGGVSSGLYSDSTALSVAAELPPADETDMAVDISTYRIAPRDEIKVEVFGAPELTRQGEVDAAGMFTLPLMGGVAAAGRTPSELSGTIADQLRGRYLKNPQVSVSIVKAQPKSFTVDGAVRQPGVYPILGRMTLQRAIASARGTSESANLGSVVVFRTVNNRKMAALFDLKDIRTGRTNDPDVYGNDVIVVGESAARRFFNDLTRSFPMLGTFVPVL